MPPTTDTDKTRKEFLLSVVEKGQTVSRPTKLLKIREKRKATKFMWTCSPAANMTACCRACARDWILALTGEKDTASLLHLVGRIGHSLPKCSLLPGKGRAHSRPTALPHRIRNAQRAGAKRAESTARSRARKSQGRCGQKFWNRYCVHIRIS